MTTIRLNKFLALSGIGSRRKCDDYIQAGRVSINGQTVTSLGQQVSVSADRVLVDGREVKPFTTERVIMLNKPAGYIVSASDTHDRQTVFALLHDVDERIFAVGRLDVDTEGLLLLTNNGDLAYRITHPKYNVRKVYHALVEGIPSEDSLNQLRHGVLLDDGMTAPARVRLLRVRKQTAWVELKIVEGRKREVRRMGEFIGHPVLELKRVAIDRLQLGNLKIGQWRDLTAPEIEQLKRRVNLYETSPKTAQSH